MAAYYNENDPFAAAWLRNLVADGLIAAGDVDERDIADVGPGDLEGYTQCHFFAGIGGWSYALRLAGWPDDSPVWTGSAPCQPLSVAGKQRGHADRRHVWPAFYRLIAVCRPAAVIGEQVASADGREWLAGIRADLEGLGYAIGAADLCAAGVGAPHIRQRLFWVADSQRNATQSRGTSIQSAESIGTPRSGSHAEPGRCGDLGRLGNGHDARSQGHGLSRQRTGQLSPWTASCLVPCADGRYRRIPANAAGNPEPGLQPLAHGVSQRVGLLRGAGNAIVPQIAAEFIRAALT